MKKQKKQNLLTVIIIILVVALIMMVGSIVYEEKINMSKRPVQDTSSPIEKEDNKNDVVENEDNETPAEEDNEKPQDEPQQSDKEYVGEEEKNEEDSAKSKEDKAIELVKKEWGNDDSVTFNIEQKKDSKYYVAVKSENEPTVWYEVDTETWEVSEY